MSRDFSLWVILNPNARYLLLDTHHHDLDRIMPNNTPLTLDLDDPRVAAAQAAEQTLYDFYGIRHTVRYVVLPSHKIRV